MPSLTWLSSFRKFYNATMIKAGDKYCVGIEGLRLHASQIRNMRCGIRESGGGDTDLE